MTDHKKLAHQVTAQISRIVPLGAISSNQYQSITDLIQAACEEAVIEEQMSRLQAEGQNCERTLNDLR
jgi:hypothetical protein